MTAGPLQPYSNCPHACIRTHTYIYIHIYEKRKRDRERERESATDTYVHIYICIQTYVSMCVYIDSYYRGVYLRLYIHMYVYMFVYLRKFVHFLHTQLCYKKWESICCATWACYLSTCSSEQTGMEFRKLEHGLRMTSGILVMVVVAAWTTAVAGLLMFSCAGGGAGEGSDGCFFCRCFSW